MTTMKTPTRSFKAITQRYAAALFSVLLLSSCASDGDETTDQSQNDLQVEDLLDNPDMEEVAEQADEIAQQRHQKFSDFTENAEHYHYTVGTMNFDSMQEMVTSLEMRVEDFPLDTAEQQQVFGQEVLNRYYAVLVNGALTVRESDEFTFGDDHFNPDILLTEDLISGLLAAKQVTYEPAFLHIMGATNSNHKHHKRWLDRAKRQYDKFRDTGETAKYEFRHAGDASSHWGLSDSTDEYALSLNWYDPLVKTGTSGNDIFGTAFVERGTSPYSGTEDVWLLYDFEFAPTGSL